MIDSSARARSQKSNVPWTVGIPIDGRPFSFDHSEIGSCQEVAANEIAAWGA
jgi:hypothetical protein